jgi:hypothetical protein
MKRDEMKYDEADLRVIENSGRFDANESIFFARQLEYVKSQTYDVKRIQLNALTLMPVSTEIPEGATTHTYRQYDSVGMAKVISNYANDLPRADVVGKEFTSVIRSLGNAYGYNVQEIRSAMFAGINLSGKRAMAATRAQQELVNKLAFSGDADHNLPGLLNNANIPEVTLAADGTGSSKTFAAKAADKIVRDVNALINKVITQSKGVHRVSEVWMPVEQYALIATTQNSTASDTTILEFLQKVHPGVTFRQVVELDGAGASGADRMYAIENSRENWQLEIPMMIKQYSPQQQGLEFVIPVESRFAGVIIEYPLAFAFADGI